ncbi:TIGR04279 domain-containing protein [Methanosarcina sp. UBA5]|uniref:TIGR04279 domain-containing protein n=1 Tax=Methanosarcina sp. UBA5 TaxID=1915593 RepID=UPI0025F9AAAA|nr:TIGR04279 domain-containing protein [Methanosarcina sp. UBA5]
MLSVFLCMLVSLGAASSSSWEITPQNPVVGDVMEIKGTGFTGENTEVMVTFEKEVQVVDGSYECLLEDVTIPSGFDNRFTVQAVGGDDLNVRAKVLLWITKSSEAKNGIAAVSQKNVPPGTYEIKIDGKSSASTVKLKITASQKVEVDSGGSLSYEYNTKSMPSGNFEVKIGGSTKKVELQPAENGNSGIVSSREQNSNEGDKSDGNSWNNLKFILSHPYSLHSFYTANESVKISYDGPETLGKQRVDIYLIKEHSPSFPENTTSNGTNESAISLESLLNNTESYIQIPATLNEYGDLSPLTLGPLPAGNYWALITLAGNETEKTGSEKKILLSKYFEVLEHEMEAVAPYTVEEGENFEVNMRLKNATAQRNYTYWAVLIKDSAYKASEGTNPSGITTGIRPVVNGVDLIKSLETSLIGNESENGKDELKNKIQTMIGEDNGTISIGEKNQSNLSLKSLELSPGDYLLITGAYENKEGLAGMAQKELRITAKSSQGLGLESSLGNTFGSISSMKNRASQFMGIKSILETPKAFMFENIKQIFKQRN